MIVPMTTEEGVGQNYNAMVYHPFHTDSSPTVHDVSKHTTEESNM